MHRLFVALRPPPDIRDMLLDTMEGLDGARWQDSDNLHLTLRFLGEVATVVADDLAEELARVRAARFALHIAGVGHFEKSRQRGAQPHALWAAIPGSGPLEQLRRQVDHACARTGLAQESRRFVPHITLARLNGGSGNAAPWLARHGTLRSREWLAQEFSLYESRLTDHGSTYDEVVSYPLG